MKRCYYFRPITKVAEYLPNHFQIIVENRLLSYEVIHDFYEIQYRYTDIDVSLNTKEAIKLLEDLGYNVQKYRDASLKEYSKRVIRSRSDCLISIKVENEDRSYSILGADFSHTPDFNMCRRAALDRIASLEGEGRKVNREESRVFGDDVSESLVIE